MNRVQKILQQLNEYKWPLALGSYCSYLAGQHLFKSTDENKLEPYIVRLRPDQYFLICPDGLAIILTKNKTYSEMKQHLKATFETNERLFVIIKRDQQSLILNQEIFKFFMNKTKIAYLRYGQNKKKKE